MSSLAIRWSASSGWSLRTPFNTLWTWDCDMPNILASPRSVKSPFLIRAFTERMSLDWSATKETLHRLEFDSTLK